nr:hypothetical protein [Tanacetum cinerariifolium]
MIELRGTFQAWLQQRKDQVCQKTPFAAMMMMDSLIIGDEHLDTIPETKSDEFIKSSVENLVPKKNLFLKINATIKSFSPSHMLVEDSDSLRDEIDLFLTLDVSMPPGIEDDDYDSKGDILIFEELLSNDSLSCLENDSFHFDIPSSPHPPAKPPDDEIEPNLGIFIVKVPDDDLWREHSYLGCFISPFLPFLTSSSMGGIRNSWILKTCAKGFVLQSSLLQLH